MTWLRAAEPAHREMGGKGCVFVHVGGRRIRVWHQLIVGVVRAFRTEGRGEEKRGEERRDERRAEESRESSRAEEKGEERRQDDTRESRRPCRCAAAAARAERGRVLLFTRRCRVPFRAQQGASQKEGCLWLSPLLARADGPPPARCFRRRCRAPAPPSRCAPRARRRWPPRRAPPPPPP